VFRNVAIIPYALVRAVSVRIGKAALVILLCVFALFGTDAAAHSPHDKITGLAVSPGFETDQTLFCTLVHYTTFILKSEDGGLTWQPSQIDFPHLHPSCLVLSPDFVLDGVAFLGTDQGHVFKSTDSGSSWESMVAQPLETTINHIALSPVYNTDQTLFVASSGVGIFKSTDGGTTWITCNTGLGDLRVNEIAISPAFDTDQTLFAATEHGFYKSTDSGATWFNPLTSGAKQFIATSVALSPTFDVDQIIYVGARYWGVFRSDDGGSNWIWRGAGLSDLDTNCVMLSPSFDTDQTLFLATREAVHKSTDAGTNWTPIEQGLAVKATQTNDHYWTFGFSPAFATDQTVFLAGWEGVHKSRDDTTAWRQLNVFSQRFVRGLAISPEYGTDGTVFAATYGGGVYRSEDHGDTWLSRCTGLEGIYVAAIEVSPELPTDSTVFVGNSKGLERSTIAGNSWNLIDVNPNDSVYIRSLAISPDFASDRTLIGGNGSEGTYELYLSTDGGTTFDPIAADFDGAYSLQFSPNWSTDQTIYAGTNKGIYRTLDGSTTWDFLGLTDEDILGLALSPAYPTDGIVFVGSRETGVYRSTDFGATWDSISNGITDPVIESVRVSPDFPTDGTLFAATKTRGVFMSTDSGDTWTNAGLEGKFVRHLVVSPEYTTDQTLYAGSWDGVYRTEDNCATWERVLRLHRWDDQSEYIEKNSYWTVYRDPLASARRLVYANEYGARAGMMISGETFKWIGAKAPFAGIARIYIDGVHQTDVDLYWPYIKWQEELFTKTGLTPGPHYVYIAVTGTKNPSSTGKMVTIDAFEITN